MAADGLVMHYDADSIGQRVNAFYEEAFKYMGDLNSEKWYKMLSISVFPKTY